MCVELLTVRGASQIVKLLIGMGTSRLRRVLLTCAGPNPSPSLGAEAGARVFRDVGSEGLELTDEESSKCKEEVDPECIADGIAADETVAARRDDRRGHRRVHSRGHLRVHRRVHCKGIAEGIAECSLRASPSASRGHAVAGRVRQRGSGRACASAEESEASVGGQC